MDYKIAELADRYAMNFILDYTEYRVDGVAHQELTAMIIDFFDKAIEINNGSAVERKIVNDR